LPTELCKFSGNLYRYLRGFYPQFLISKFTSIINKKSNIHFVDIQKDQHTIAMNYLFCKKREITCRIICNCNCMLTFLNVNKMNIVFR